MLRGKLFDEALFNVFWRSYLMTLFGEILLNAIWRSYLMEPFNVLTMAEALRMHSSYSDSASEA